MVMGVWLYFLFYRTRAQKATTALTDRKTSALPQQSAVFDMRFRTS